MKAHLTKVSLALLSTVFLLGCQDMGSGPVGPEGPQFDKKDPITGLHDHGGGGDDGGGGGCGNNCVFVNVELTGWMITDPVDEKNQMELARKPGIIKLRANTEKNGTPYLNLRIDMDFTLAAALDDFDENCEWLGPATKDDDNVAFARESILPFILDHPPIDRSVLVVFDENAGESENNTMGIFPVFTTGSGFRVKGSPTVEVMRGDITEDAFEIAFSGGVVGLGGLPPGEPKKNSIHLECKIFDVITFTVGIPPAAD